MQLLFLPLCLLVTTVSEFIFLPSSIFKWEKLRRIEGESEGEESKELFIRHTILHNRVTLDGEDRKEENKLKVRLREGKNVMILLQLIIFEAEEKRFQSQIHSESRRETRDGDKDVNHRLAHLFLFLILSLFSLRSSFLPPPSPSSGEQFLCHSFHCTLDWNYILLPWRKLGLKPTASEWARYRISFPSWQIGRDSLRKKYWENEETGNRDKSERMRKQKYSQQQENLLRNSE